MAVGHEQATCRRTAAHFSRQKTGLPYSSPIPTVADSRRSIVHPRLQTNPAGRHRGRSTVGVSTFYESWSLRGYLVPDATNGLAGTIDDVRAHRILRAAGHGASFMRNRVLEE